MSDRTKDPSGLSPVSVTRRIVSIDVLRGIALLGILLINIVGMAFPEPAYYDPSGWGGDTGWNLKVFVINSMLFEGTMRGIFSMLFGAGVIMFTSKIIREGSEIQIADAWYRRTIYLALFGMIHAYFLLMPDDILFTYGIVGLFLFPLRNLAPRKLMWFSLIVFLIITGMSFNDARKAGSLYEDYQVAENLESAGLVVPENLEDHSNEWQWLESEYKFTEGYKEEKISSIRQGYFSALKELSLRSYLMESIYFYRHGFLDALAMMLLGMAFFKWRIFHAEKSYRFYTLMMILGYGIGLTVNWMETSRYIDDNFSVLSYLQITQTYDLGRLFTMLGHIGLVMIFCKSGILSFFKRILADVGRMAFSNYILQTILANTVFILLGKYGEWERYQLYYLVGAIWLVEIIFSYVWMRYFSFGPLEWIWRRLTYGKYR